MSIFDLLSPYMPVIAAVGAVVGLVSTALAVAEKLWIGRLESKLEDATTKLKESRDSLAVTTDKLAAVTSDRDQLAWRLTKAESELAELRPAFEKTAGEVVKLNEVVKDYSKAEVSRGNTVKRALEMEGAIWTRPVMAGTPPFRPLAERQTPIVSVINLKGGVGKTTLTAYLGWALAARGYRVLMVDLDLQGSLSSFFVPNLQLAEMEQGKKLLRHYLDAATVDRKEKLLDYAVPVPQLNDRSRLVATTDKLAYSELGQSFRWLLRVGSPKGHWSGHRDGRMLLRRALHAKGLAKRFDIILLDCPPLLNLCCANALAASDFLLVPVTPNVKAIERVTPLLKRVAEVRGAGVNPDLSVLGLVTNRHQERDLTAKEVDLLGVLPQRCYDVLKTDLYTFDTTVPQRAQIRDAEDAFAPPDDGSPVRVVFEALAEEFIKRLPGTCRQPKPTKSRTRVSESAGGAA